LPSNGNTPDIPKLDIPTLDYIDISESDVLAAFRKLEYNLAVTECRDLGVAITNDLSLSSHISDIIIKAH